MKNQRHGFRHENQKQDGSCENTIGSGLQRRVGASQAALQQIIAADEKGGDHGPKNAGSNGENAIPQHQDKNATKFDGNGNPTNCFHVLLQKQNSQQCS